MDLGRILPWRDDDTETAGNTQIAARDLMESDDIVTEMDAEVKRVADLFQFLLKYQRHFQPSGIEFSDLRQYLPTDDASRIDWKKSAGKPDLYVKEFEEEVDMDTYIVLDISDSMLFGSADQVKAEYAGIIAGAMAYASVDAGINVGLGMYADGSRVVTPDGGMVQYRSILRELTDYTNYGGEFHLENTLADVNGQIKENTAVFLISDFIDTRGDWMAELTISSEKFRHVMGIMVRDRLDYELPDAGTVRFQAPNGSGQLTVDTAAVAEDYAEAARQQEAKMERRLKGAGASFLKLDTRDEFAARFASYFDEENQTW